MRTYQVRPKKTKLVKDESLLMNGFNWDGSCLFLAMFFILNAGFNGMILLPTTRENHLNKSLVFRQMLHVFRKKAL